MGAEPTLLFNTKLSVAESYLNSHKAEFLAVESVKPPCPKFEPDWSAWLKNCTTAFAWESVVPVLSLPVELMIFQYLL